jgi:predicted secreted protein
MAARAHGERAGPLSRANASVAITSSAASGRRRRAVAGRSSC